MAVDIKVLENRGATDEKLKALFETDRDGRSEKLNALIDMQRDRIRNGIDQNLRDARFWWAIDQSYDVAHRQTTYTQVRGLMDKNPSQETVRSAATDWGITHMMTDLCDKTGKKVVVDGQTVKKLDLPTFFNIFVPVVMAYTKIRWAKLYNDRDLFPFYKYEPLKVSMKNRVKTEIITDRIQRMVMDMGYKDDEKQSIFQMLLYGVCLNFPCEDYFKEQQIVMQDGKEKTVTVKEGVRFSIPHPSRMFYDLNHRPSTFNYDTGAEYAGYWEVVRYQDVARNEAFWNRETIKWDSGSQWPWGAGYGIFSALFPCAVSFPDIKASEGVSDLDRQNAAFQYTKNDMDAGVNLVPFFHKVIPSEWGLYDYDYPVWHRFVYAGQDTVVHCKPLAYSPIVAYLYDYDNNRARNASLGLELLPWQDHLGNLLTQYILSVKKNLTRVVFFNKGALNEDQVELIKNAGEKLYQELRFIPFSPVDMGWQQQTIQQAFFPVEFPPVNTSEIVAAVNTMIGICERVLGFSSQELGASASHEQSAREVSIIAANTSVRMNFTGGFVDEAIWARKKLLYDAMMAYSSDDILAEIADMNEVKKKALEDIGFEIEDESEKTQTAGVKGKKSSLALEGFASEREGANRINDTKLAASMVQTFQSIFNNPLIVQSTGVEQLFELFNQILVYAGMPQDFKLRFNKEANAGANVQQAQEAMVKIAEAVVQKAMGELGDVMKNKVVQPIQEQQQQITQAVQALGQQNQQEEEALKVIAQKGQQAEEVLKAMAAKSQQTDQALAALAAKDQQQDQALMALVQKLQALVQVAAGPGPGNPGMPPQ